MKGVATTIDRIVNAASDTAAAEGVAALTIGKVAERAGISTALVHYHFDTKRRLLVSAAGRLATRRQERRVEVLGSHKALALLDALWSVVEADVASGAERAWLELQALARGDEDVRAALALQRSIELGRFSTRLPGLLRELGSSGVTGAEEMSLAVIAQLDGFAAALTAGESAPALRTAYDAFWLAMIASGPGPGGRRR